MSILDRLNLFSNDQAITASAASTDVIDLGSSPRDVGAGEMSSVLILITEGFNNLTSLTATLETAPTDAFSPATTLVSSTLSLASLTVGARFPITTLPRGTLRYLRLYHTVNGSAPSTGKITAGVGAETVHQDNVCYPDSL